MSFWFLGSRMIRMLARFASLTLLGLILSAAPAYAGKADAVRNLVEAFTTPSTVKSGIRGWEREQREKERTEHCTPTPNGPPTKVRCKVPAP